MGQSFDKPPLASQPEPHSTTWRAKRYWRVMRNLLKRDYLRRASWSYALRDLARMAKVALGAQEALVAVLVSGADAWSAVTSEGERLDDTEISLRASRSVLEHVRQSGQPVLQTGELPLDLQSASLQLHQVHSVLSIPLHWWDVTQRRPQLELGACLYVHRTLQAPAFTEADVELLTDIADVAQRTLNILRYLKDVQSSLKISQARLQELERATVSQGRLGEYATRDPWFAEHVVAPLSRAAKADRVCLLLLGPTGSGKSHLAQAYHRESPRRDGAFVVLDCSQVTSEQTLAAELFGYAPRSGFANAPEQGRPGAAELAHKGTLFVDEITTLPLALQQRLLSLIQNGVYSPLGSSEKKRADLQILAATNEDLTALVRQGRFREDLYWRLSELTVCLPPLSGRPADIPALAEGFLREACERFGRRLLQGFTPGAEQALRGHDWSSAGNLRGLQQTIHRSVLFAAPDQRQLGAEDLRFQPLAQSQPPAPRAVEAQREPAGAGSALAEADRLRTLLERKLQEHRGSTSAVAADPEVAQALGYAGGPVPRSSLRVRLCEIGLEPLVAEQRQRGREELGRNAPELRVIEAAIREHRSGSAAARALNINRDVLAWQLRRAGLSVRKILAQGRGQQG